MKVYSAHTQTNETMNWKWNRNSELKVEQKLWLKVEQSSHSESRSSAMSKFVLVESFTVLYADVEVHADVADEYGFLFCWLGLLCLSFHQQSIAISGLNSVRGTPSTAKSRRSSSVSFDCKDRLLVLMTFICDNNRSTFPIDAGNDSIGSTSRQA